MSDTLKVRIGSDWLTLPTIGPVTIRQRFEHDLTRVFLNGDFSGTIAFRKPCPRRLNRKRQNRSKGSR